MEGAEHIKCDAGSSRNVREAAQLRRRGPEEVCLGLNYTPPNQSLIIEVEKGLVSATPLFFFSPFFFPLPKTRKHT